MKHRLSENNLLLRFNKPSPLDINQSALYGVVPMSQVNQTKVAWFQVITDIFHLVSMSRAGKSCSAGNLRQQCDHLGETVAMASAWVLLLCCLQGEAKRKLLRCSSCPKGQFSYSVPLTGTTLTLKSASSKGCKMLLKPGFLAKVPKVCGSHRAKQDIWCLRWFSILLAVSRKAIHGLLQSLKNASLLSSVDREPSLSV